MYKFAGKFVTMEFSLKQIADLLNGTIEGNPDAKVSNISKIEEGKNGTLSFLANPAYTKYIYTTEATAVLVRRDFLPEKELSTTLIRVDDPYIAFTKLLQMVETNMQSPKSGICKTAVIANSVKFADKESVWISSYVVIGENVNIGRGAKIYPHTFIDDNCHVGENTKIYAGVKIYAGCSIGNNCIIHSGVVIGSDGFGFAPDKEGNYTKIPQLGNVIIEDNVEIGANTSIDRATIGSTIIRSGSKLDNLIQVAHNCEIGKNTVIAAQSGFAGSSKIGDYCMIGGQVAVKGHLEIGNHVKVAAQSGVASNLKDKSVVIGSPAFEFSKYKRVIVHFKNLDEMNIRICALEKKLNTD